MKINYTANQSFKSKNMTIQDARKICEVIHTELPHESFTFLKCIDNISLSFEDKVRTNIRTVRQLLWKDCQDVDIKYCRSLINYVKQFGAANCGENSYLADIMSKINGFKDFNCFELVTQKRPLDHWVASDVFIPDVCKVKGPIPLKPREGDIIIDSWLSDADAAPNMIKKYAEKYDRFIGSEGEEIWLKPVVRQIQSRLAKEDIQILRENFPELLFENIDESKLNKII